MKLFNAGCVFIADPEIMNFTTVDELDAFVLFHCNGRCGEIMKAEKAMNENALETQGKYSSLYTTHSGYKITITTDIKNLCTVIRLYGKERKTFDMPVVFVVSGGDVDEAV